MTLQLPSINIIFEDDFIFALSKPPGCHSVKGEGISVADALEAKVPFQTKASPNPSDAGLVTRLDYETSGILLGAKTDEAWEKMRNLLRRHLVEKSYFAILEGTPPERFEIKGEIGSRSRSSKKVRVFESPASRRFRSQPAITRFLTHVHSKELGASYVEAISHFGRRHQIRAHAAFSGNPLLGDALYGSKRALPPKIGRAFFLHAQRVAFLHPYTREKIEIRDPSPSVVKDLF